MFHHNVIPWRFYAINLIPLKLVLKCSVRFTFSETRWALSAIETGTSEQIIRDAEASRTSLAQQSHNTTTLYTNNKPTATTITPMQPSSSFDDTADRKAKALSALQKAKKVSTVKGLIAEQKAFKSTPEGTSFQSGATLDDVVKNDSIELVGEFYKFVK